METFYLITGFISLVAIIVFFVMASDIRSIKNKLLSKNHPQYDAEFWLAEYQRHFLCNREDKALYALQEYIYYKVKNDMQYNRKSKVYDKMVEEYGDKVTELGGTFMKVPDRLPDIDG